MVRRGPKGGPKIKPLSAKDKHNASRKTRGIDDDTVWKLVGGILRPVKKKK